MKRIAKKLLLNLPLYVSLYLKSSPPRIVLLFYLAITLILFYSLKKRNSQKRHNLKLILEDLKEKVNILNDQNSHEHKHRIAWENKISRYHSLKKIIEEISQNITLETVADKLSEIAFSSIAHNRGVCILYLIDPQTQLSLNLFKTKKEDKTLIIKAKEGDIFDRWVLRHTQALLIEDIRKDFRFDLEKLKTEEQLRPISSLISSPFISEHRFLGTLRLDSPLPNFYSQDDLRFLATLCDLGAVALENAQLFQKTQDLAIHDELTSFYTKGYFLERLGEECKRAIRQNRALSLLLLDIDYFNNYNNKFGHTAGDIVLKNLSQNIADFLKGSSPIISRFGGEEFCVILSGIEKQEALNLAEKLRLRIEMTKIILRGQETRITVSIGVASFLLDARDEDDFIFKADTAMYEAKSKGRNRVCGI